MGKSESSSGHIQVTSSFLNIRAQKIESCIKEMRGILFNTNDTVTKSSYYWIGDAGNTHRYIYKQFNDQLAPVFQRFTDQVQNLRQMAGVYNDVEEDVTELAQNTLPTSFLH